MEHDLAPEAYLVHAWIRDIHPMLWQRFLVRSDECGEISSFWAGGTERPGRGGYWTTASDELGERPILGGWLRIRCAPYCQTPRRRAGKWGQ